jgi:hypothetical protein
MKTLRVGISTYEEMKARTMAIARGLHKPAADDPKVWFTSAEAFARCCLIATGRFSKSSPRVHPSRSHNWPKLTGRQKSDIGSLSEALQQFWMLGDELVGGLKERRLRTR